MGLLGLDFRFDVTFSELARRQLLSSAVLVLWPAEGMHGLWAEGCRPGWLPYTMSQLAENLASVQKHLK